MTSLKLLLVGAGLVGLRHIDAIHRVRDVGLAAIVDPSEAGILAARTHDVPHFEQLDQALTALPVDGAILATPNHLHVPQGLMAIAAKVPILVEKPISDQVETAIDLVNAARSTGVPVAVGHHRRHNPVIQAIKAQLQAGVIGRPVAVHGSFWLYKPDDYFEAAWRTKPGAGPVFINLIHDIDLMRYLLGDIAEVQAMDSNAIRRHDVEDTAVLIMRFESGVLGTMTVSDTVAAPWSWELTAQENPAYPATGETCYWIGGTEGSIEVPSGSLWRHSGQRSWWAPIESTFPFQTETIGTETTGPDPLDLQIEQFCRVIRGEEPPLVSAEEGLKTLMVVERIKAGSNIARD